MGFKAHKNFPRLKQQLLSARTNDKYVFVSKNSYHLLLKARAANLMTGRRCITSRNYNHCLEISNYFCVENRPCFRCVTPHCYQTILPCYILTLIFNRIWTTTTQFFLNYLTLLYCGLLSFFQTNTGLFSSCRGFPCLGGTHLELVRSFVCG